TLFLSLCVYLIISPLSAYAAKVVVDAGHGGSDPGAIGVNGLREKDANLDISLRLQKELLDRGYEVLMTRTEDVYLSLGQRVNIARQSNADLFVSIHANSYHSPDVSGALILYYDDAYPQKSYPASEEMKALTPESKRLAQLVLDEFVSE